MLKYKVHISPRARQDLNEIYDLAEQTLGKYWADLVVSRIWKDFNKLEIFPLGYGKIPNIPKMRKLKSRKYLIIFLVNEESRDVIIVDIFYSRRNYPLLLKNIKT